VAFIGWAFLTRPMLWATIEQLPVQEGVRGGTSLGTFAATIRWRLSVELFRMQRLGRWFKGFFGAGQPRVRDDNLPFTAEEFRRLISSGKSEDMRILARGLAQKSTRHASNEKASIQ
jgi:hypothetical protein